MRLNLLSALLLCSLFSLFVLSSCQDEEPDPCDDLNATYNGAVKAIIDVNCATSGCHSGPGANTFIPTNAQDYTSFIGIDGSLNNGFFTTRVLEVMDMPIGSTLTTNQIEILTCWKDAGFPEN